MAETAIVLALSALATASQAVPAMDFTGTWVLDAAAGTAVGGGRGQRESPGGGRGGGLGLGPAPESLTIEQRGATLTIDERRGDTPSRVTYRVDGAAATNAIGGGRSAGASASHVSTWTGGRLVTTITVAIASSAQPLVYQETRWIAPDGSMVVETRRPGLENVRRVVYRRRAPVA